jgi:hypothetical protein
VLVAAGVVVILQRLAVLAAAVLVEITMTI